MSCWFYGCSACLQPGAFLNTHFILQPRACWRGVATVILSLPPVWVVHYSWARVYIEIMGQRVIIQGAAGDIDIEPALVYDFIHLWLAAVAACGTPAVAGFRAVARTHTISTPGYRHRRFSRHISWSCPVGRCHGYIGEEMGCCCSGVYLWVMYEF